MKNKFAVILCFVITLPLFFTSCQKEQEGVFNPKKKIERIYYEYHEYDYDGDYQYDENKQLKEVWEWDGDLLSSITYCDSEYGNETYIFSYDGKRLSQVRSSDGRYRFDYEYENGLITCIQTFQNGEAWETIRFTHTGNKISRIEETHTVGDKGRNCSISPLRFVLSDMDLRHTLVDAHNISAKCSEQYRGEYRTVYELEWEKDNVKKIKSVFYWNGNQDFSFWEYTYDTKMNPFYNSFQPILMLGDIPDFLCFAIPKNNVVTVKVSGQDQEYVYDNTYSYEGAYPIVEERNLTSWINEGVLQNCLVREVFYYEYK